MLVSAGPTQKPLDPVRFLTNRSSGRPGFALAEVAAQRGARALFEEPVPAGESLETILADLGDLIGTLRGKWHKWRDIPVMVTYHPSYLLRAYNVTPKREAWEDLKKVLHYVYD